MTKSTKVKHIDVGKGKIMDKQPARKKPYSKLVSIDFGDAPAEAITDNAFSGVDSGWIQTASCRKVYPLKMDPAMVSIEDIAHALSNQCRWSGHCKPWFSVAEHCIGVAGLSDEKDKLWGLLHDASEAYLVDLPTPIKRQLPDYQLAEQECMAAICKRFKLPPYMPKSVKAADEIMLAIEAKALMSPLHADFTGLRKHIQYVELKPLGSPEKAKQAFLQMFERLTLARKQ